MPNFESIMRERFGRFDNVKEIEFVRRAFESTLTAREQFLAKASEIEKDANLSPIGRQERMRDFVSQNAHAIRRAKLSLTKAVERHAAERARLVPKPDPSTADLRRELRQVLREQTQGARVKVLLSDDSDPLIWEAAIEGLNLTSGIDDATREMVLGRLIERRSPGALAAWEVRGDAIAHLNAATRMLETTAQKIADVPPHAFDAFVEKAVGNEARLEAEIDREIATAA